MRADARLESAIDPVLVTTTAEFDSQVAGALALRDPRGVLSVYVGIDPVAEATARPPWEIALDAGLQELKARVRAEGERARWVALEERLRSLAPALARIVDSTEHGRGRALFAGVDSGETRTIHVQELFPTSVAYGAVPHVLPLLALDDGHAVGIVSLGRKRVRALEAKLGAVSQLAAIDVEPVLSVETERKGPAAPNPLHAQHVVAQRERYERHLEADHRRRLRHAAEDVAEIAAEHAWELAAVVGDPRGTGFLRAALGHAGVEVELVERDLDEQPSSRLLAELEPTLATLRRRRDLALVAQARAAAASGGNGALGLADVLGVLAEGRVARLLLTGGPAVAGSVGPAGELAPPGVVLPGLAPSDLKAEPLFADRMAFQALDTGARVTVLGGEAAAALADADGVAALLRW